MVFCIFYNFGGFGLDHSLVSMLLSQLVDSPKIGFKLLMFVKFVSSLLYCQIVIVYGQSIKRFCTIWQVLLLQEGEQL